MLTTQSVSAKSLHAKAFPLYLTGFAAFIGLYLPQPILPLLADTFGVDAKASSLIISLTILGIGLASPFMGILSDRFGRRRILILSSSLLGLSMLGCALSSSFSSLLIFRFLQGLLLPGLFVVAVAYTSEHLSKEAMTTAAGVYVAMTVIGGMIGRLLAGSLADLLSWRYGFLLSSLFYFALIFIWAKQKDADTSRLHRTLKTALSGTVMHLRNKLLVGGLVVGFFLFFAFQATFNYLPFKLKAEPFGLSSTFISFAYLSFVAGMVSAMMAGYFRKRFSLRGSFVIGFSLAILGNLMTLSASLSFIFMGLLVLCFGNWLVQGLAVGYVATATDNDRASANALYLLFYYLGGSLGGYLPGLVFISLAYPGVILFSVSALALGLVAASVLLKPVKSAVENLS